jgi:hypothetical protein
MALRLPVALLLVPLALAGCASGRVKSDAAQRYQGHVVDSVEMHAGEVVIFDSWDNNDAVQDTRARIAGDAVVGYVSGVSTRVPLRDASHVTLAKDDSPQAQRELFFVVAVGLVAVTAIAAYATALQ